MPRPVLLLAAFLLAACATPRAEDEVFDPVAFFEGESRGAGILALRGGAVDRRFTVRSTGEVEDGTLRLTQTISMEGEEPRTRIWTIRPVEPGLWRGELSDARGPVTLHAIEGGVSLSYAPKDLALARIEQHLYPQGPGRVVNEGTVRVLGITVRRMHEVIEKNP